jgi:hypothetical protein
MRLRKLAASAALAMIGTSFIGAAPVQAQGGQAQVRVAHFSPDAPAVDIYIDGKKRLTGLPYQQVSDYLNLPEGSHTFAIRATNTDPTSKAAIEVSQPLKGGKAYTVAAIGKLASIKGALFEDDRTPPAAGKAKVRVIHAAPDVPSVDVAAKGGATLFKALTFPTASPYIEVDATDYDLQVKKAGTEDVLLNRQLQLTSGGVYTIAAVGGANQPVSLKGLIDLTPGSAAATPAGGDAGTATTVAADGSTPAGTEPGAAATTVATAGGTDAPTATDAPTGTDAPAATDAPVATDAPPATDATGSATTVAAPPATDAPDAATTVAEGSETTVAGSTPKGGVESGFGGMSDSQSNSVLALVGVAGVAVSVAAGRRRLGRR